MTQVVIKRIETGDEGTFGVLSAPGFECYTAELPRRGNIKGESCIPAGTYKVVWAESPTRKNKDGSPQSTYRLEKVKGREGILIHAANWTGDHAKGYVCQVEGCIALGRSIQEIDLGAKATRERRRQRGVSSSADAVAGFEAHMDRAEFTLIVCWAPGVK